MTTPAPCKRPKVVVAPRNPARPGDAHDATCHVPRCGWTYPADRQFMALKSDANEAATRHRQEHRAAVPRTWINPPGEDGPEYDIHCEPCGGHRRTFGTRTDAQAWLDHHLSTEHGLVTC